MTRSTSLSVPVLLLAAAAAPLRGQELTRLEAFYGSSQPTALCAAADEQRVYVADGATVTILDTSTLPSIPLAAIAQVPVNASIANLLADVAPNDTLYIAGGTFGLLKMSTTESGSCDPCTIGTPGGCHPVTVLDDDDHGTPAPGDNEKACLDVAFVGGQYLVATFGARDKNEVRLYDLATVRAATGPVTPLATATIGGHGNPLYAGPAHALAVRASKVYVALGGQGLARVDFANPLAPVVVQGPVFGPAGNPFPGQPGDVRDVVAVSGRLYAAVDGMGLAEIDLGVAWNATTPVNLMPLADTAGDPRYPYRLDAVVTTGSDFTLAVACNAAPAMAHEAIPFSPWGAMSFDVGPGNLPSTPLDGAATVLLEFPGTQAAGVSPTNVREVATGEWQGLRLHRGTGTTLSYELHKGTVLVRDVDGFNTVVGRRPQGALYGKSPPRIGALLSAPRLLLTSVDGYPLSGPFLSTCAAGCIETIDPVPGESSNLSVIADFDAQWFDASTPGYSWLLRGRKDKGWWLMMISPGAPCGGTPPSWLQWRLMSAPDQYGLEGRLAFLGHIDDAWDNDLLLATRTGTRDGLCAYSRSGLVAAALANMPAPGQTQGPDLACGVGGAVCPVFTADTHPEFAGWQHGCTQLPCGTISDHFAGKVFNLDCATVQLFDPVTGAPRWAVATAAGYHSRDPNDPVLAAGGVVDPAFHLHAMAVLHDLGNSPATPTVLARLYSTTSPGNATDVATTTVNGSSYAVVTDYGGHVHVFDVTTAYATPGAILLPAATWTLPTNPYDGLHDNATEVVIDQFQDGGIQRTLAYVACYRRGVEVLELTNLPQVTRVATLDTPGITEGVALRRIGAQKRLLVACRSGGVQVFAP
ncbi:MAG: hypothetical protein AB7O97_07920 [Planctomycetota bacterium]